MSDSRNRRQHRRGQDLALVVEDSQARRAAQDVDDVEASPAGHEIFDGGTVSFVGAATGLWNHNFGLAEIEMGNRQPQDLAAGRMLAREQVERWVSAELDRDNAVSEARQLGPVAIGIHEVVRELAAIAIAD